jgi:hypothetical protein
LGAIYRNPQGQPTQLEGKAAAAQVVNGHILVLGYHTLVDMIDARRKTRGFITDYMIG